MKILFLQRKSLKCGVSDYGKRLFKILAPAMDITFHEIEGPYCVPEEYDVVLVNYHHATIPWPLERGRAKMIALFHEAFQNINPDKWVNVSELPRPVPPHIVFSEAEQIVHRDHLPYRPAIGTFGFGFAGCVASEPDGVIGGDVDFGNANEARLFRGETEKMKQTYRAQEAESDSAARHRQGS